MKNRKRNTLWMLVSIILILTACGQRGQYDTQFARIDSLTDVHPDSALSLLQDIESKNTKMPTSARMRLELLRAQAMNKAFIDFTSDSLGLQLCKYYDHHGNANDQMKAYYLLGCAYRDLGDMPQALKNLHNAADRADTTRMDCDFKTLSMVYSQMCSLFNQEMLPNEQLETLDKAGKYALIAKDTLNAIVFYELRANAYEALGREDSISSIRYNASKMYKEAGFPDRASLALGPVIYYETKRGNLAQAKKLIDSYESESGAVDSMGNVLPSHLIFYYIKGNYWLAEGKRDSAEKYFRKEVALHNTNYHLMFGYKGLLDMFKQTQTRDSIAKYAELSYEMKDSCYTELMSLGIQRTHAMYNYQKYEKAYYLSEQEKQRGESIMLIAFVVFLAIATALIAEFVRRRKEAERRYQRLLLRYERMEADVNSRQQEDAADIKETAIYKHLMDLLAEEPDKNIALGKDDWQELETEVDKFHPQFRKTLESYYHLSDVEYHISLLTKLNIEPSKICRLVNRSKQTVSTTRTRLFTKVFGRKGNPADWDQFIDSL